jgi:hypothetical protein
MSAQEVKKAETIPFGDHALGTRLQTVKLPKVLRRIHPTTHDSLSWFEGTFKNLEGSLALFKPPQELEFIKQIPPALVALCIKRHGYIRPGFLGSKRTEIESALDKAFGEQQWRYATILKGKISPAEVYLRVYENAYLRYFQKNPDILLKILTSWSDVFDTAPTNVSSGFNYSLQESPQRGSHLHDIAVRTIVNRLGLKFSGQELVQIRSHKSAGGFLSPGVLPFSDDKLQLLPPRPEAWDSQATSQVVASERSGRKWWEKDTIEDAYQRMRCITTQKSRTKQAPSPGILAANAVEKVMPLIIEKHIGLSRLSQTPWAIPIHNRSDSRQPSALPPSIAGDMINQFEATLAVLAKDGVGGLEYNGKSIHSLHAARSSDHGFLSQNGIKDLREALIREQRHVSNIPQLIYRAKTLFNDENTTFVFLARDGLAAVEYCNYLANMGAPIGNVATVYIPGSPRVKASEKNAHQLTDNGDGSLSSGLLTARGWLSSQIHTHETLCDLRKAIRSKLEGLTTTDEADSLSTAEAQMVVGKIGDSVVSQLGGTDNVKNIVVIDTFGTGKSTLFISETLRWYFTNRGIKELEVRELLGQPVKEKPIGLAAVFPAGNQEFYPDISWPFFAENTPTLTTTDPHFQVRGDVTSWVRLLMRSCVLHDLAVGNVNSSS